MTNIKKARNILSLWVRYFRISYIEAKASQSGTYLGLLWVPLSSVIFSVTLGLVFKHSDDGNQLKFCLYVLSGYTAWGVVSDAITKSVDVIQTRWDFAVHNRITLLGLFAKQLSDKMVEYILNILGIILFTVVFTPELMGFNIVLLVPVAVLMALTYMPVAYIINIVTIFYPDFKALIRVGARFLFFVSPVFWTVAGDANGMRGVLVRYNPLSYYLSLPRQAVGVEPVDSRVWLITVVMTSFIILSGWVVYRYTNRFVRNLK